MNTARLGRGIWLSDAEVRMRELPTGRPHRAWRETLAAFGEAHPEAGARPILTRTFWIQSALAVLLALAVRLLFLARTGGMVSGDEAVLGVQAERILHGAHPVYFYGQAYMGSWDAYLLAPIVAVFGPSAGAIHAVTLAESLLLVPIAGALAVKLYGRRALLPALFITAVLPLYDVITELQMLGGYVETLVLGTALMLLMTLIAERWDQGRSTRALWIVAGLLVGLSLWIDVLIAYYLVACTLWLAPLALARLLRLRAGATWHSNWRAALFTGLAGLLAGGIGAAPAIHFAITHKFANLGILLPSGKGTAYGVLRLDVLRYYVGRAVPVVLGIRFRWPLAGPGALTLVLGLCAAIIAVCALLYTLARLLAPTLSGATSGSAWRQRLSDLAAPGRQRWNDAFPLLLVIVIPVIYWRNQAGTGIVTNFANTERYVLPLCTALVLLLARLLGDMPDFLNPLAKISDAVGTAAGRWRSDIGQYCATGLLLVTLIAYFLPFMLVDAPSAMQSSFAKGNTFPTQNAEMVEYLEQQHIHYVWANHWVGDVVIYLSSQQVLCSDDIALVTQHAQNRFPEIFAAVSAADRPSFIVQLKPSQKKASVEVALDNLGVIYQRAQFGALVVITPLTRTVRPSEILIPLLQNYSFE
jgi:hypothetical protein